MGGKGSSGKAKPKFKSYAEARKDREKFRKKLVNCHCDANVDAVDVDAVDICFRKKLLGEVQKETGQLSLSC